MLWLNVVVLWLNVAVCGLTSLCCELMFAFLIALCCALLGHHKYHIQYVNNVCCSVSYSPK